MPTLTGTIFDDEIFGTDLDDTINGLFGDDDLYGGVDIVDGDFGNDTLTGGPGADDFRPGLGNDVITDFTAGVDLINLYNLGIVNFADLMSFATQVGGDVVIAPRIDEFRLFNLTLRNVTLAQLTAPNFNLAGPMGATVVGTEGADVLWGMGGDFVITHAFGGDDTILSGPTGFDRRINGGTGNDTVIVTDPVSTGFFMGESGFDTLVLRPRGANTIIGNVYNFTTFIASSNGVDLRGFEELRLESVAGTQFNVTINLFSFDLSLNRIVGGAGAHTITTLIGSNTIPTLTLINWGEDDTIVFDMSFNWAGTFTVPGTHVGLYRVVGSPLGDTITGSDSREGLDGANGNDTMDGRGGSDLLNGGDGDDIMTGGAGDDTIDGGGGLGDEARFSGNRADYLVEELTIDGTEYVRVTGQGSAAGDGVDLLRGVEYLQFADQRINIANSPPVLGQTPLPDQTAGDGQVYSYQVPITAFTDPDPGTVLTYSAILANGWALPGWLSFNAATRTFTGTPPYSEIGNVLQVRVTASDNFPGDPNSTVSDVFALTIVQAPGPDITGTASQDNLNGSFRGEQIFGLADNDTLAGFGGGDRFDGGTGFDTVTYFWSGLGVTIDLALGQGIGGEAAGDQFVSIEGLRGSAQADVLLGSAGNDTLDGMGGVNTLSGRGGDDRLLIARSGSGSHIDGGAGFDTLAVEYSFIGGTSLGSLAGIEAVELLAGATLILTGAQAADGLALNAAFSGSGTLTVNMTEGVLFISRLYSFAGSINVLVYGTAGNDAVAAGNVAHAITAGDGFDQIKGGSAADRIDGGAGNDKIIGNGGADVLWGGSGNDTFKFRAASDSGTGSAADQIADFEIGDRFNFSNIDTDPGTAGDQGFAFIGGAAFGASGAAEIRYQSAGGDMLVQADVNGDGLADMEVLVLAWGSQSLTAANFVL
jgi:Ca2+-binding RTX toxin-like protein